MKYSFLDHELISRLGAIPLETRQAMLGTSAGRHRSPLRGSSVEFAEYRKYVQGDDTRRLDWKAFARSDRFYIKEFEADTNLRLYTILDTSGSMNFSFQSDPKIEMARKIAATLSYLAADQGDAAALACCSDKINIEIPPRRRASHLQKIFQTLNDAEPTGETSLIDALHAVAEKAGTRAMIVVLSDFFVDLPALTDALQHLNYRKHDVTLFHLMHQQEIDFEFRRPHRFVDMEDKTTIVAEPTLIADDYRAAMTEYLAEIKSRSFDAGADYRLVTNNDDTEKLLSDFLLDRQPKGGKK